MQRFFRFNKYIFQSVLEGRSILDVPRLNITNLKSAHRFAKTYGFDLSDEEELKEIKELYRLAIQICKDYVLEEGQEIPEILLDEEKLGDISHLLVFASAQDGNELQKWSCSLLRIMHVLSHLYNDPFHRFSEEIQRQVLKPIKDFLHKDPVHGYILGHSDSSDRIDLKRFDVKAYKGIESASLKLLAKRSEMALLLMDRIGVRFVTNSVFDSYRALRFLMKEYVISVPNLMPDQAKNTLYPFNLFLEVMDACDRSKQRLSDVEVEEMLNEKLEEAKERAEYKEKENRFSGDDYRVIKFIARVRIKLQIGEHKYRFFYPYEIQIMDYNTYTRLLAGPSEHSKYKERQAKAAKDRVKGVFAIDY
jgi:uncharacterized protein (TIGR04562 family)